MEVHCLSGEDSSVLSCTSLPSPGGKQVVLISMPLKTFTQQIRRADNYTLLRKPVSKMQLTPRTGQPQMPLIAFCHLQLTPHTPNQVLLCPRAQHMTEEAISRNRVFFFNSFSLWVVVVVLCCFGLLFCLFGWFCWQIKEEKFTHFIPFLQASLRFYLWDNREHSKKLLKI